jgi:hypothetical protein
MTNKNEPWFEVDFGLAVVTASDPLDTIMLLLYHYDAGYGDHQKICFRGAVPIPLLDVVCLNLHEAMPD